MAGRAETIAFIEKIEQIDQLFEKFSITEIGRIIALTPQVEYALERRGLAFRRPEDYYDENELEEFGIANFKRVEEFCKLFDKRCQAHDRFFRINELRPAWSNFYYLKVLFDAVTIRLFALKAILDEELPERVIFYATARKEIDALLLWDEAESIYSPLIDFVCRHRKIVATCLKQESSFTVHHRRRAFLEYVRHVEKIWFRRLKNELQRGDSWFFDLLHVWTQGRRSVAGLCKLIWSARKTPARGAKPVLFCSTSHSFYWWIQYLLRRREFVCWLWREGKSARRLSGGPKTVAAARLKEAKAAPNSRLWQNVAHDRELLDFFLYDELNWFPLVEERLRYYAVHGVWQARQIFEQACNVLDQIKPRAVLFTKMNELWAKTVARAAETRNIPVVAALHGAVGANHLPVHAYSDFLDADWNFVFGEGVAAYVRKRYSNDCRPVVTGTPMLEDFARQAPARASWCRKLGLDPKRKIVVYVLTGYDGNHRYISYRTPSDSTLFRIQRRIITVFKHHPEIQFVIKGHEGGADSRSIIVDLLRNEAMSNCSFIDAHPFSQMIHLADLFIVDHPLTSLLQMCMVDTPIYIFNNLLRWEDGALQMLGKRAEIYRDLQKFCDRLNDDLTTGECFNKKKTNDEFVRCYGLPKTEQSSVETMTQALHEVLKTRERHGQRMKSSPGRRPEKHEMAKIFYQKAK